MIALFANSGDAGQMLPLSGPAMFAYYPLGVSRLQWVNMTETFVTGPSL